MAAWQPASAFDAFGGHLLKDWTRVLRNAAVGITELSGDLLYRSIFVQTLPNDRHLVKFDPAGSYMAERSPTVTVAHTFRKHRPPGEQTLS
jgi:hypothetical protein